MKASDVCSISACADVFNGKTPSKPDQRDSGYPVLKIRDVDEDGRFRGRFESYVDKEFASGFEPKKIRAGDTLILNAAHNADYVGSKQFLARPDVEGALATGEWLIVRPDNERLDSLYAHYWLTSDPARRQMKDMVKGIHLYPKDVARLEIPLPRLTEQRRIAAILDKADALRRKRKRAIELLDSLTQSIFLEMFVAVNDSSWPLISVEALSTNMRTGPFGSQLLHSEFVDDGIAVLGIDNAVSNNFQWGERRYITHKKYKELHRYTVHSGDVLITIMGTCGRCAVVPDNIPVAINTKHLCCITLDQTKCLPEFLQAAFLQHPYMLRQLGVEAKGAVMPGLNMGIIKALSLSLPPIDLQRSFVRLVRSLRSHLEACVQAMIVSEALFTSLQHRAFSGQL